MGVDGRHETTARQSARSWRSQDGATTMATRRRARIPITRPLLPSPRAPPRRRARTHARRASPLSVAATSGHHQLFCASSFAPNRAPHTPNAAADAAAAATGDTRRRAARRSGRRSATRPRRTRTPARARGADSPRLLALRRSPVARARAPRTRRARAARSRPRPRAARRVAPPAGSRRRDGGRRRRRGAVRGGGRRRRRAEDQHAPLGARSRNAISRSTSADGASPALLRRFSDFLSASTFPAIAKPSVGAEVG